MIWREPKDVDGERYAKYVRFCEERGAKAMERDAWVRWNYYKGHNKSPATPNSQEGPFGYAAGRASTEQYLNTRKEHNNE